MKPIYTILSLFLSLYLGTYGGTTESKEVLRSADSIPIKSGKFENSGILSDDKGFIFLEVQAETRATHLYTKTPYQGELLPPTIIDLPAETPKARIKEIFSFEILTDTSDTISFTDKFILMHEKELLKEKLLNPEGFIRSGGAKIFIQIFAEEAIQNPVLWIFLNEEDGWQRIGGKLEESSDPEIQIFSATLNETGVYTLFDENPAPTFTPTFPLDQIILAETSPFPSIEMPDIEEPLEETAEFLDEASSNVIEGAENLAENLQTITEEILEEEINEENSNEILIESSSEEISLPIEQETINNEIPAIKESPTKNDFIETNQLKPSAEKEINIPKGAILPKAGGENSNKKTFPFILVTTLLILISSLFLKRNKLNI